MRRSGSAEISSGKASWIFEGWGLLLDQGVQEFMEWMDHQDDVASTAINECFGPMVEAVARGRKAGDDWSDDRYNTICTLTVNGTTLLIDLSIYGLGHLTAVERCSIAERLMRGLREHAFEHLESRALSPQEEFARYLDPAPTYPLA